MNTINWKIRFHKKNFLFLTQTAVSLVLPVLTYFGLEAADFTTWHTLWDTAVKAISNPYVVLLMLTSLFHAVTDPTTSGIGDSPAALTYREPKKGTPNDNSN